MGKSDKPDPMAVLEEKHAAELRDIAEGHTNQLVAVEATHAEAIEAQDKRHVDDMNGEADRLAAALAERDAKHSAALKKSSVVGAGVASGLELLEGDGDDVVQAVKAGRVAAEMIAEHRAGNLPEGDLRMHTLAVRVSRAVAIASQEIAPPVVRAEGAQSRTNEGLAEMGQEEGAAHRISPKVPRRQKYKRETEAGRRRASGNVGKRAKGNRQRASDN